MDKKVLTVGIDPGKKTGIAIYDGKKKKLLSCETLPIHRAFEIIKGLPKDTLIMVVAEDARQRRWYGSGGGKGKQQGAGAIKIQCSQWEDFLKDLKKDGIIAEYRMIHPVKGGTKINSEMFKKMTGFNARTSNHARDAGIIAWTYGQSFRYDTLKRILNEKS